MSSAVAYPRKEIGQALDALETPCLVLEKARLIANVARLKRHLQPFGVRLRPHLKTAKSIDVARLVMDGAYGPVTVSTLREAEYFFSHGVTDLLYAVGIAPNKLDHVFDLRRRGANLAILLDNLEIAQRVASRSTERRDQLPVFIEIDTDGHRSGVKPQDQTLITIGRALHASDAVLRGVMTHAGSPAARTTRHRSRR
jgi:D-serine deaminase-like pyridoxal phosphate-dependent protein